MRSQLAASTKVALFLFASGFCALVYQTVCLRMFRLVFGASTLASAGRFTVLLMAPERKGCTAPIMRM